ncbi:glycosyl hydrolase 115 family protein [Asticcacaulis solisilvae]|uniref:glycosyl hydrolase 115 family protein n=1 Tax=Asticcacaulis solisilvae TaxID=1217274 RepID=UPI003FD72500
MRLLPLFCLLIALPAAAEPKSMVLADTHSAADIVISGDDAPVVGIAAHDLSADIASVTGMAPAITESSTARRQVWIGTIGKSPLIDSLAARIGADKLKACWECFVITTVDHPAPGVDQALVIAGSDRRGAAYGAYEVSRMIGVSPWVWWADVKPEHQDTLTIPAGLKRFGPPSVKYRGLFINDEDWGLEPWAAKTFDPAYGNIGPKTYERVFDLMLRLRANTLWPAMHPVTRPFNGDPANAALADRYAIVMGASHAEPMLRNNVGEWKAPADDYNYATNPEGVKAYWRERLKTNKGYENLYTIGMRGIHDSPMMGAKTPEERRELLNKVLADQRQLIRDEIGAPEAVAQIFVPYKEVLDIYRTGLDLPDDVTVVWPDDNFGYIRQFPTAAERQRKGGSGVYYHLSYLGAPLSYIWLSTTPPDLIREELTRAYDNGVDRLWMINAGDIKPAEVSLSYVFDLAWDVKTTRKLTQRQYLDRFAKETFGADKAEAIGGVLDQYYRLNFARKPEHLQWWWGKGSTPKSSPWTAARINARMAAFDDLRKAADGLAAPGREDALFELVQYPAEASALANQRYFALECAAVSKGCDLGGAGTAHAADDALKGLTAQFGALQHGKWAGLINEEPADAQWTSFRIAKPQWPGSPPMAATPVADAVSIPLKPAGGWTGTGLGLQGKAGASLTVEADVPQGFGTLRLSVLPTFPTTGARAWRLGVQVNDATPMVVTFDRSKLDAGWQAGVLDNALSVTGPAGLSGHVRLRIVALDPDVVLEGLDFVR